MSFKVDNYAYMGYMQIEVAYGTVNLASYNRREDLSLVAEMADLMAQLVASGMVDLYDILEHMNYTYLRYEIKLSESH